VIRTTVFTCSIYPDLTRVWYHLLRRTIDPAAVTTVIYDCGSRLRPEHFPGARIERCRNVDHGRKIDRFLARAETPLVYLSDDDVFLLSPEAEPLAAEALLGEGGARRAALSFKPRGWWQWQIDGTSQPVMGSYAVMVKPEVIRREALSFRARPTADPAVRAGSGFYDTADHANRRLLDQGYEIVVPEEELRRRLVQSFAATSSGFVGFARRRFLARDYRPTHPPAHLAAELRRSLPLLERACGVAAALHLHHRLFPEPPRFETFFTYDELADLAAGHADPAGAAAMVGGYRALLDRLEALAP
jgi:hypothetical protein